jgi:predicted enzyme related to lactoylglutathione lyase
MPLLRAIDAITVPVPSLDAGIAFYAEELGHRLLWRNDALGQAGLALPDSAAEIVLATGIRYEPNWLVADVDAAVGRFRAAGGAVLAAPSDTPVGRLAVVQDPFGNPLVLLDLSRGRYTVGPDGDVTGVG